jgi:acyl-CoA thioester hydrolase
MKLPPLDPAKAATRSDVRVRFFETDLMGIVHHAVYLTYFEAGRVDWLRRRGITYTRWTEQGIHLPVVDATLRYRAPARFDDVLCIETTLADLRWASLRYAYTITRGPELLAEGETRLACVDGSHALRRIPPEVLDVLAAGEVDSPSGRGTV